MAKIFYDNDADGPPVDRVFVENQAASFRAVSYLLDIGHSRVAVLTGDTKVTAGRQRYEGYRQALISRGFEIDPAYVLDSHWNENEAYSGMLQLLTLPEPPTAVYCCNYNMGVGALRRIKVWPLSGLGMLTTGGIFTLSAIGRELPVAPRSSVATAVTRLLPGEAFVQTNV